MSIDTLANRPTGLLSGHTSRSAIWPETPSTPPPDATEKSMPASGGIVPGQTVHFIPVNPTGNAMCEEATVEEVWSQADGVVSLRLRDDLMMHRIGYSAEPLGNSWHYGNQCEGRGTMTEHLGDMT